MSRTISAKLNMTPGGVPPVIHVSQYDSDFSIVFSLYNTDGVFTVENGTTAEVRGTKRDGKGFSANASINISAKTVTVTGDQQMTAICGDNVFELMLKKNSKELNTANFILSVESAALDRNTIVSESKILELLDVTDRADDIIAAAELVEETLATLGFSDPQNDGNIVITMGATT